MRIFCRENCEGENVFINTTANEAARGRSSIKYFERVSDKSYNLTMRIPNLTHSDSGLYKAGLTDPTCMFIFVVAEEQLDGSKDHLFIKEAGSSLTVACSFKFSGTEKYFCKGECGEEENILLYTDGVRAESGRYSIGHEKSKSSEVFYVTIKNLTRSDSGRYRCFSYLNYEKYSHVDFNISVSDVSRVNANESPLGQNKGATSRDLLLIVIVGILAVIVILLSASLLVSYRRRSLRVAEMSGSSGCQPMETVARQQCTSGDFTYENFEPSSKK